MAWRRWVAAALVGGLASTALAAPRHFPFMRPFRAQHYRSALSGIRTALSTDPDDADLHAYLGIAHSRIGQFADAIPAFAFCLGSSVYEGRGGLAAHADALRATGHASEAAALRHEGLATLTQPTAAYGIWLALVDDYRWAGDPALAEDAAMQAIAIAPTYADGYGLLAEVQMDAGEREDARLTLWLAALLENRTLLENLAEARLALLDGDLEEAERVLDEDVRGRWVSYRYGLLTAEIWRRRGDPEAALATLEAPRLWQKERPEMMAALAAVYADMGELEQARELRDRGLALYPRDPDVLAAAKIVDRALAR